MKFKGLAIAAVLLLGLGGWWYWSEHHKPAEKSTDEVSPKILSLKDADISRVELKNKGEDIVLKRNAEAKWEMTAPNPLPVDQDTVSTLVSTLATLEAVDLVEEKPADVNRFGLGVPAVEITIGQNAGKSSKLLIGDEAPAGNGSVYVKLEGDTRVFTVASNKKSNIVKSSNDLRDKRLLTVDSDKIGRVELIVQTKGKAQSIEFGRNKDEWQILKPKPLRADNLAVGELVRKAQDAKMDTTVSADDAKKAASAFASGTPVATVKLTDASRTQELQVRKSKDDYYAKSNAVEGVYKVANDLGTGLEKSLDDFRNKKLFDFGFNEPSKIEIHDGGKAYAFTKSGEDWSSSGKKMDPTSVQSFIDKLRDLSAAKFVDTGFTTPTIDVTVTSNDGKRVEKVLISNSAGKYIAKRDNEPSLYEIDSKTVADLATSANDVKPSAPAPAKK